MSSKKTYLEETLESVQEEINGGPNGLNSCIEVKLENPSQDHIDLVENLILYKTEDFLRIAPCEGAVYLYGFDDRMVLNGLLDNINDTINRFNQRLAKRDVNNWLSEYMEDESLSIRSVAIRPEFYNKDDVLSQFESIRKEAEEHHASQAKRQEDIVKASETTLNEIFDSCSNLIAENKGNAISLNTIKNVVWGDVIDRLSPSVLFQYLPLDLLDKEMDAIRYRHNCTFKGLEGDIYPQIFHIVSAATYGKLQYLSLSVGLSVDKKELYALSEKVAGTITDFLQNKHFIDLKEAVYAESEVKSDTPWRTRLMDLLFESRIDLDNYMKSPSQALKTPSL